MQADVPCQNRFKAAACQTFATSPAGQDCSKIKRYPATHAHNSPKPATPVAAASAGSPAPHKRSAVEPTMAKSRQGTSPLSGLYFLLSQSTLSRPADRAATRFTHHINCR